MAVLRAMLRLVQGPVERYGLPRPEHGLGAAHPTVSSEILSRVAHGAVVARPNIAELLGDSVRFTDGTVEPVDVIIYCTGYKVTFPFFDESLLAAADNDRPLFRRVFRPRIPDLAFIGLLQPLGAIMPLSEAQGRWVADYLAPSASTAPIQGRLVARAVASMKPRAMLGDGIGVTSSKGTASGFRPAQRCAWQRTVAFRCHAMALSDLRPRLQCRRTR